MSDDRLTDWKMDRLTYWPIDRGQLTDDSGNDHGEIDRLTDWLIDRLTDWHIDRWLMITDDRLWDGHMTMAMTMVRLTAD